MEDGEANEWVAAFRAWVWKPDSVRIRGISTARLEIYPGGFAVRPRASLQRWSGWPVVEYRWPAVVIETLIPLGGPGLLFEMSGRLARCVVRRDADRVRGALARAGLAMIEVRRWGWEASRVVPAHVLGEHAGDVPRAVRRAPATIAMRGQ